MTPDPDQDRTKIRNQLIITWTVLACSALTGAAMSLLCTAVLIRIFLNGVSPTTKLVLVGTGAIVWSCVLAWRLEPIISRFIDRLVR